MNNVTITVTDLPISKPSKSQYMYLKGDRDLFMLNEWLVDNPDSNISSWEELSILIQENQAAQKWATKAKAKFSGINQMPDWVLGDSELMDKWGLDNTKVFENIKNQRSRLTGQIESRTAEFKLEIAALQEQLNSVETSFIRSNPLLAINKISISQLPLDLAIGSSSTDRDTRLKEQEAKLSQYKIDLAKKFTSGLISIEELIGILK